MRLGKLEKLQRGGITRAQTAAELLKEQFPRGKELAARCEKLLAANTAWPVEFQVVLRNGIDA